MSRKYGIEYWLKEIKKEEKTHGREFLIQLSDQFLSREEQKAIRKKLDDEGIEHKSSW